MKINQTSFLDREAIAFYLLLLFSAQNYALPPDIPSMNEFSIFKLSLFPPKPLLKTRNSINYYSLLKEALAKKSNRLKNRKLIHREYTFVAVMGGPSIISSPFSTTYAPTSGCCFYQYKAPRTSSDEVFYGIMVGEEVVLATSLIRAFDMGISYYETANFHEKGTLMQGVDLTSAEYFNYRYTIKSQQLLAEGRLLLNTKNASFSPYLLGGLGTGLNQLKSYRTNVPPFMQFTPRFVNHQNTNFLYSLGAGLEQMITRGLRTGLAYRFSDAGKTNFQNGILDDTLIPFSLQQTHLYNHQIVLELRYLFT